MPAFAYAFGYTPEQFRALPVGDINDLAAWLHKQGGPQPKL